MALKSWISIDEPTSSALNDWVDECPNTVVLVQELTGEEFTVTFNYYVSIDILLGTYLGVVYDGIQTAGGNSVVMEVISVATGSVIYTRTWSVTASWVRKTDLKLISGMVPDGRAQKVVLKFTLTAAKMRGLTVMVGSGNTIAKYGDSA